MLFNLFTSLIDQYSFLNVLLLNTISHAHSNANMNGNIYDISNPDTYSKIPFPTIYEKINSSYEFFDVYSPPITTRYAEVYWTMMPKVELPEKIVN